jgi:hypothetical protein
MPLDIQLFSSWLDSFSWPRPPCCQGFEIIHNDAPQSVDSSERVISPTQRPLPVNTQHWHETDFHNSGGIRTRNSRKRTAADPRLRSRGKWAQHAYHLRLLIYPLSSGKNNWIKHFLLTICHRISGSATARGQQDVKTKEICSTLMNASYHGGCVILNMISDNGKIKWDILRTFLRSVLQLSSNKSYCHNIFADTRTVQAREGP